MPADFCDPAHSLVPEIQLPGMQIKYTPQFLNKLEQLFSESGYMLRYEKGNFKAGYCLLKDTRIAIVNKYFTTEGKINCLIEMLRGIQVDASSFNDKNKKLYQEIVEFIR